MAHKLGKDAAINYKVGGQTGGGAWITLGNVMDVTLDLSTSEADVTTRNNKGWKATVAAIKDGSVDFDMVWDTTDAGLTAIKDAFLANGVIGLQVFDGPSGEGLQADWMITSFSRTEPLEEAIKVSVTAKPTFSATAPSWLAGS